MGMGIDMVVPIFLLRGAFLVEQIMYHCAYMWLLTVASEIGVYLVTWFIVNSGQDLINHF